MGEKEALFIIGSLTREEKLTLYALLNGIEPVRQEAANK
jgi:hypothetical protein